MTFRPRLSAVLLTVNLAVIALPLGSIVFFRIYENQLIQETERELISQAAMIGAVYRQNLLGSGRDLRVADRSNRTQQQQLRELSGVNRLAAKGAPQTTPWKPINPTIDLAAVDTLPSRPDGAAPTELPSAAAASAGRSLSPILNAAQRTTLIGVRVLDEHGTAVGGTAEVGLNFAHVWEVGRALTGEYTSALRARELENAPSELKTISRGTGVRVFVALPITEGAQILGVVYLSRTPKSVFRHMYENQDKAILALITVLVLAGSLAMLTSRTISRPVAELLARTRRVTRGEAAEIEPLRHPGTAEVAELSDGISQMAKALSDRAAYIRTLASAVSHEFKTPLTSIEGAAELLQDHHDTMTAEERQRFLVNIAGDGARLRALLDRLLDLAKAENMQNSDAVTELEPAVRAAGSALPDRVTVTSDIPSNQTVRITDDALALVLGNLLDNAVKHGATQIDVSSKAKRGGIEIAVRDNGNGITPANREKIFDHFFTTRREAGGTGLGLGIVKALLTAHGGTIDLAEPQGAGACFTVFLRR
ncbi:MAG: HAMP domain-containing sensor histidine kinase [Pseudomonadota bacterium]